MCLHLQGTTSVVVIDGGLNDQGFVVEVLDNRFSRSVEALCLRSAYRQSRMTAIAIFMPEKLF